MPLLNLENDDAEYLPVPTSKVNWVAAAICTIITFYLAHPWRYIFTSPGTAFGSFLAVIIVLTIPIAASVYVVRYNTRFKNSWGIVFVIGWFIGELVMVAFGVLLYQLAKR